jgi:hypothetical protein
MPYLNDVVVKINENLLAGPFKGNQYQKGMFYGIATPALRKGKDKDSTFPCYRQPNSKDMIYIGPDDRYPIIIYHKLLTKVYSQINETDEFGDTDNLIKQTCGMQMIIFAQASKLNFVIDEQLESAISLTLVSQLNISGLLSTFVQPVSASYDQLSIFNNEYKNVDPFMSNDHLYLSINYTIENISDNKCFNLCADC